jgi:glycine/D-amino acid oxidase-like deaminating enzyme
MTPSQNAPTPQKIIVVGAGIIGASLAWHLVQAGASVTIAAATPGGEATPNSFAWINASWGNPEFYFHFRRRSMAEWKRLAKTLPSLPLKWCGGLCWDLPPEELDSFASGHSAWGYEIKRVGPTEINEIEPCLVAAPPFALHVAEEGAVEPEEAANILLSDAVRNGATLLSGIEVQRLATENGRVIGIETASGIMAADVVVLAAGAGTVTLAATAGIEIPLESPPGLIVHSKPARPLLTGLVLGPELHMRQTAEGRIIAGSDFAGTDPGENPQQAAKELFAKVKAMLRGSADLELDFYTVGYRPTPQDGLPIIGTVKDMPGVYLAVTHSGVTLAPIIGLLGAAEIADETDDMSLKPFRLARFG